MMRADVNFINNSAIEYHESIENQITTICHPLKYLNITHFGHCKFFKDGTYLHVCSNLSWIKFFLNNSLVDKTTAFAESIVDVPLSELDVKIWPQSKGDDCLSALYEHNIWNGITMAVKEEDLIEIYYFGTEMNNNQIFDLYTNHLNLLMRFKAYFQEKAAHLIEVKDKKILTKQSNQVSFFAEATQPLSIKPNMDIDKFLNKTTISRHYLSGKHSHIYLTKREAECLWYLSQGRTSKETGKIMNLSPRAIEAYINNVKYKTDTRWKGDLIDIFLQSSIKDILKNEMQTLQTAKSGSSKILNML